MELKMSKDRKLIGCVVNKEEALEYISHWKVLDNYLHGDYKFPIVIVYNTKWKFISHNESVDIKDEFGDIYTSKVFGIEEYETITLEEMSSIIDNYNKMQKRKSM